MTMNKNIQQVFYKNNILQQLRGFFFTAQFGTVSKAANHMLLQQSTISTQIKSLERDLDTPLFERHGPKLTLTKDGEILYQMAMPLLEDMDHLYETFLEAKEEYQSRILHIAANQITAVYLLPKIIKIYKDLYPNIEITIHDIPPLNALDQLLDDEVDIVIGTFLDVPKTLKFTPLYDFDTVLVSPKDHPLTKIDQITLDDVAQYDLVRIAPHLITVPLFEEMCSQFKLGSNIKFVSGDWTMLKEFVRAGVGVCIISNICISEQDSDLVARPLNEYFGKLSYGTVVKQGRRLPTQALNFLDVIENHAKAQS